MGQPPDLWSRCLTIFEQQISPLVVRPQGRDEQPPAYRAKLVATHLNEEGRKHPALGFRKWLLGPRRGLPVLMFRAIGGHDNFLSVDDVRDTSSDPVLYTFRQQPSSN